MKNSFLALAFAMLVLVACSDPNKVEETTSAPLPAVTSIKWDDNLNDKAVLIERLPENTLTYIRIPSVWGMISSPKSNALQNALSSKANQTAVSELQSHLKQQLTDVPAEQKMLLEALFYNLRSPIEVISLLPQDMPITSAQIVIGARLNFTDIEQINAFIENLVSNNPDIKYNQKLSDSQSGLIQVGPAKFYFNFNTNSQRFIGISGMAVLADDLQQVLKWKVASSHKILEVENRIDTSRRGLFTWVNLSTLTANLGPMIPQQQTELLRTLGLMDAEYLAFGEGVANNSGKFSLLIKGKSGLIWNSSLPAQAITDTSTAGTPEVAMGFHFPDAKWLETLLIEAQKISPQSNNKGIEDWQQLNLKAEEAIGLSITDIMNAIAGQIVYVSDQAGGYFILSPQSANAMDVLLQKAKAHQSIEVNEFSLSDSKSAGKVIEVIMPGSILKNSQENKEFNKFLQRLKSRIYLKRDGDHYLLASVPQIFVARDQIKNKKPLQQWVKDKNINAERSMVWIATSARHVARQNYYFYLQYLQTLGDLLQYPVDIKSFPSAWDLQLPETSDLGMQINYSQQEFGIEFIYDSHPGEYFQSGSSGMATVAVIGILAAIAIPAYQDYTERAKISEVLFNISPLKDAVSKHYSTHKNWPSELNQQISTLQLSDKIKEVQYQSANHTINIVLKNDNQYLEDKILSLQAEVQSSGSITWRCFSDNIPNKSLPPSCR